MLLRRLLPPLLPAAIALLAACPEEPPPPPPVEAPPPEAPPAAPPDIKFDVTQLQAAAEKVALVPSPAEMQRSLSNAGLTSKLASMVEGRDIKVEATDKDQVAVRTGVVLAHVVLSCKEAPKEKLTAQLGKVKAGMQALGAGDDIAKTIDDLSARIANDAVSRDDLVKEMDELSGVMVPELEFEGSDRAVPLIQAGAWLEGAHLVSGAIKAEKRWEAAGILLRQPEVVRYFREYVKTSTTGKAPDAVIAKLDETLGQLETITAKDQLTEADVVAINDSTGAVLAML